jgi:hypothetical protein
MIRPHPVPLTSPLVSVANQRALEVVVVMVVAPTKKWRCLSECLFQVIKGAWLWESMAAVELDARRTSLVHVETQRVLLVTKKTILLLLLMLFVWLLLSESLIGHVVLE